MVRGPPGVRESVWSRSTGKRASWIPKIVPSHLQQRCRNIFLSLLAVTHIGERKCGNLPLLPWSPTPPQVSAGRATTWARRNGGHEALVLTRTEGVIDPRCPALAVVYLPAIVYNSSNSNTELLTETYVHLTRVTSNLYVAGCERFGILPPPLQALHP
ncbi:hypothetical protein J6590_009216 [Homalodisca vitripennis]|nr:hypothetical protein J6590_009216 [Homalodisca vitripennis]